MTATCNSMEPATDEAGTQDWEGVYQDNLPRVRRICARYLRDDAMDAEDVAQDVLLKLCRNWNRFRGMSLRSTWVHSVAMNECLDWLRKQKRKRRNEQAYGEFLASLPLPGPAEPEPEVRFSGLFARMSAPLKRIALMYCRDGMTQEQIAANLGVTRGAVAKRFLVFRKQLEARDDLEERNRYVAREA